MLLPVVPVREELIGILCKWAGPLIASAYLFWEMDKRA